MSDPSHPLYVDEADVRGELARVFDVCNGCRRCVDRCAAFPAMFEYIGRHEDSDAGRLTPAQQDRVVDECFHCTLCAVGCPYVSGHQDAAIDLPRLMVRAKAMRVATDQVGARERVAGVVRVRPGLVGALGSRAAPVLNRVLGAPSGSTARTVLEKAVGVSSVRLLAPFARQRFSTWFARRPKVRMTRRQGRVAVFPTCIVEFHQPEIGHDLVKVYERNGVECTLVDGVACCGAPLLHHGQVDRFVAAARQNVTTLAAAVREGREVVVPQPTCSAVIRRDYPVYVGGADAELVAANTFDAVDYLLELHRGEHTTLDTDFTGEVPGTITCHVPCHSQVQGIGTRSRDLLRLTGARVRVVQQCSGGGGSGWGQRADHADQALSIANRLGAQIRRAGSEVVVGECHHANTAIEEQAGSTALHPLQVFARAYGIPREPTR